jgi:hypothetical protein
MNAPTCRDAGLSSKKRPKTNPGTSQKGFGSHREALSPSAASMCAAVVLHLSLTSVLAPVRNQSPPFPRQG